MLLDVPMLVVILAIAQLLTTSLVRASFICIEPGGRVAIESAEHRCCDEQPEATEPHDGPGMHGADCCACVDVPLNGSPVRHDTGHSTWTWDLVARALVPDAISMETRSIQVERTRDQPPDRTFPPNVPLLRC
jgi:hypothetical protein